MDREFQQKHERFLAQLAPVRSPLARYCRAVCGSADDALDLAAETIRIAYEHFDRLSETDGFRGYCFTTASRLHKRRRWRERNRMPFDQEAAEAIADSDASPEHAAEVALLYDAIRTLAPKVRDAVILFEINGLPLEEVRRIQGGSLSGVKSRIVRGRKRLAALLADRASSRTKGDKREHRTAENGRAKYQFASAKIPEPAEAVKPKIV